jgi:hypothetical protein
MESRSKAEYFLIRISMKIQEVWLKALQQCSLNMSMKKA